MAHWWLYKFFSSIDIKSKESYLASLPILIAARSAEWKDKISNWKDVDIINLSEVTANFKKYHVKHIVNIPSD